jgi:hypothetical protein
VSARGATEISQLIGFWSYVLPRVLKRGSGSAVPQTYRAFSIGPEWVAIGVLELDVLDDEDALKKVTPILNDGLKRVEVWFGSRKVGEITTPLPAPEPSPELSGSFTLSQSRDGPDL